ncbi:small subunit ribosomal protein S21e [Babesia microti strain RI]|uniref:40S ribosomal protein S21 n=1 Tax=Babesia microti (strain RI) TaxID=1133968 RepID=I7I9T4_BABMR|nr:small subunit ribosomal protein S21e [Babesia microti strain RI]CCF75594.1 small subunit ribosomal protein S21e [Babesia microti strain RI]|eukprot:XP_012650002.1 small subunit ribosomal protein S21e [Babesia microti strain RI]
MINDEGRLVDIYIPRKCSATSKLIHAKDHGSVQINIGMTDSKGAYHGNNFTVAFAKSIRQRGESDSALNRILHQQGLLSFSE